MSHIFLVAFVYITSESATAFIWVDAQFTDIVFYDNCLKPQIIADDFVKDLDKAAAEAKTKHQLYIINESTSVHDQESVTLQLCKWHIKDTIRRQLIKKDYNQKKCDELLEDI